MPHNLGDIRPVILCGGAGARLQPLSTPARPKAFLSLISARSMLQETILRLDGLRRPLIMCHDHHANLAAMHLRGIKREALAIIAEPHRCNTAPAAALTAHFFNTSPDEILLFLPCDHVIKDLPVFHDALEIALLAARAGNFVLFGEAALRPECGYGYIKPVQHKGLSEILCFHEKPSLADAAAYVAQGYLWNSGIVMVRAGTLARAFETYAAEIWSVINQLDVNAIDNTLFCTLPNISLDHALLEKVQNITVCPVSMGWRDIGSFEELVKVSGDLTAASM